MGDPRKIHKKFSPPAHPWQRERIEIEKKLTQDYAFKNKTEIWKMTSKFKDFTYQAKKLNASHGAQAEKETKLFLARVQRLGLLKENPSLDAVLDLKVENILERRLQSLVYRQGLAKSMKQARQFITHRHITVKGKTITMPSRLVTVDEEKMINFVTSSTLSSDQHPERLPNDQIKALQAQKAAVPKETPKEAAPEASA
jgi:small subunit ribosomal protein S4